MKTVTQDEIDDFVSIAATSTASRVREYIALGIPLNAVNRSGRTPLYAAVESNNLNVIQSLLKAGADPNQLSTNSSKAQGGSPLNAACNRGDHLAIKALISKGANPKVLDESYQSAAHCLLRHYRKATNLSVDEVAKLQASLLRLIKAEAPIDQPARLGHTLLSMAIEDQFPPSVLRLLLENGANPNQKISDGKTAMHEAARQGDIEKIQILAQNGADLNATDNLGRSPLFHVHTAEAAQELVTLGADINLAELRGLQPLGYFIVECQDQEGVPAPIQYLLGAGADVKHTDWSGRSARDIARARNLRDIEAAICASNARSAIMAVRRSGKSLSP